MKPEKEDIKQVIARIKSRITPEMKAYVRGWLDCAKSLSRKEND